MNCSKCGTPIPESDQFCPNCGAPRAAAAAPQKPAAGVAKTVFGMPSVGLPLPGQPGGPPAPGAPGQAPPAGGAPGFGAGVPPGGAPQGMAPGGPAAPGFGGAPPPGAPQGMDPNSQAAPGFGGAPPGGAPQGMDPSSQGAPGFGAAPDPSGGMAPGQAPGAPGFGAAPGQQAGGAPGFGGAPGSGMAPGQPSAGMPAAPTKKGGCGKIALIIGLVIGFLVLAGIVTTLLVCFVCGGGTSAGGEIGIGDTQTVTMGPSTAKTVVSGAERPYVDYNLVIEAAGTFAIALNAGTEGTDPFLALLTPDGTEITHDDDSGGGLNALITTPLQPGSYTVRAATFTQLEDNADFVLSVTASADQAAAGAAAAAEATPPPAAAATPPPAAAAGAGGSTGCDALANCCTAVGSTPAFQTTCQSLEQFRASPAAAQSCQATLTAIRTYYQTQNQPVPAECQ